jgi:uncharacterized OB-fold protein
LNWDLKIGSWIVIFYTWKENETSHLSQNPYLIASIKIQKEEKLYAGLENQIKKVEVKPNLFQSVIKGWA